MLAFPEIDPIAFSIGPLIVRWYALAYMAGIIGGFFCIGHLNQHFPHGAAPLLSKKAMDDIMLWAVLGVVLGGRLGYVLFYHPEYFAGHPADIVKVWQGGMSFHGGMLGVIIAFYWFAKRQSVAFLPLMDLVAAAAPIGLFFGRIANFVNGELYGRVTDPDVAPLAMVFPRGGSLPRHPSQLYEAGLEGLVLFTVIVLFIYTRHALKKPGTVSGVFLLGYGLSRFIVEFFREPDAHLGLLLFDFSMGQWLCVPMVLLGVYMIRQAQMKTDS